MTISNINKVIHHLRGAALRDGVTLSDEQLLQRFVAHQDESAFAALVGRHGPLVWAVCMRVLRNHHDAEDAFQATFLVLARKAASIASRELLANWLYGVGYNTSLKTKALAARRRSRERQVAEMPEPEGAPQDLWNDLQPLLDQELSRLPDKYRSVVVLCDLEGKTRKEAAAQLGCPEGTVAGRLARARVILAQRLGRHGLTLSGGAVALLLAQNPASAVPPAVVSTTVHAATLFATGTATGAVSAHVATLADSVLKGMLLAKLKRVSAVLLMLVLLCAGVAATRGLTVPPSPTPAEPDPQQSRIVRADDFQLEAGDADVEDGPREFANIPVHLVGGIDQAFGVAFSRDGSRVAVGMGTWNRPGRVLVFDVPSRKLLWSADEPRGVCSVAFSPDGRRLAWSGWGNLVRVEQLSPRRTLFRVNLRGKYRLAYSGDGKWLAVAGENGTLRLLDPNTGKTAATLEGDSLPYHGLAFSRDGKLLAAAGGHFATGGPFVAPFAARGFGAGAPRTLNQVNLFDVGSRKQVGKLTGHRLAVLTVAFGPGDRLIATSSADRSIRLYDGKTLRFTTEVPGHRGGVKALAFSPDGSLLATGSWDRSLRLWDPQLARPLGRLGLHPSAVRDLAFSPDGRHLVSCGAMRSVKLWDVKERKELATLHQDTPANAPARSLSLAVSPDGKWLATGDEHGAVLLRDSRTGAVRKTLCRHEAPITALAFAADGRTLASGGARGIVCLWDVQAGRVLHTLEGHGKRVRALAFSRDGKKLAASDDQSVGLWDAVRGALVDTFEGLDDRVQGLAFSADDTLLACAAGRKVVLWELASRSRQAVLEQSDLVRAVAFSPDGRMLASADEAGEVCLWDPLEPAGLRRTRVAAGRVTSLAFSPSGSLLVAGGQRGMITVFDSQTGKRRRGWKAHDYTVRAVAFGPVGQRLFSLGGDGSLKLWLGLPAPLRLLEGHKGPVRTATFSPDGKYLLSCSGWPDGDRTLRLWDVAGGKEVRVLLTASRPLQSAAFSPDGKYAATGEDTGAIHLVEVSSGTLVRTLRGHRGVVAGVTFSADGRWLLSAAQDHTVRLWDAGSGAAVRVFRGHRDQVCCVVLHPDGRRVLSGGRDRTVRVWDLHTGRLLETIAHAKDPVERLAVLPDGRRFLTCGGTSLRLWDLDSGKEVRAFTGPGHTTTGLALTRDGRRAFTSSHDGSVRLWDVDNGTELECFLSHRNWVRSVEIAPDGQTFATAGGGTRHKDGVKAGDDFAIRLWKMPPLRSARLP